MEVTYHPLARRDVVRILRYYRKIALNLANEFESELRSVINRAATNPLRFRPTGADLRRANLKRFPFHFLYEIRPSGIRILIVRHNKRHPDFGRERV
jgi:plasmid stabilization system protein ParE